MSMQRIIGDLISGAAVRLFSIGAGLYVAWTVGAYVHGVFAAVDAGLKGAL